MNSFITAVFYDIMCIIYKNHADAISPETYYTSNKITMAYSLILARCRSTGVHFQTLCPNPGMDIAIL